MWMRLRRHVQLSGLHGFMVRLLNLHHVVLLQHASTWYDISNYLINNICCCNMEISHQGDIHQRTVIAGRDKLHFLQPRTRPVASLQSGKSQKSSRKFLFSSLDYLVLFVLFSFHTISHYFTAHWFLPVMNCDGTYSVNFSESMWKPLLCHFHWRPTDERIRNQF